MNNSANRWPASLASSYRSNCLFFSIILCMLLSGCQSATVKVPAVVATANEAVVWHDLLSPNTDESRRFMANVLGWSASLTEDYALIYDRAGDVVGGMVDTQSLDWGLKAGGWLLSVQTPNMEGTLERVIQQGGKVLMAPRDLPDRGLTALVEDPQGAVFVLLELAPTGDNDTHGDKVWIWHELITADPQASAAWYASVFQLQVTPLEGGRQLLHNDSLKLATVSRNPFEEARNQWIPVVAVNDFAATLASVPQWGGRVAVVLDSPAGQGKLALIKDPAGAALILQEFFATSLSQNLPAEEVMP